MKGFSGIILENNEGKILLQLRDDIKSIEFPNSWGTFGGHIEEDETPIQAMEREFKEEADCQLNGIKFWKIFYFNDYEINIFKKIDKKIKLADLRILEGQRAGFFSLDEIRRLKCAFNCKEIVEEYFGEFH